MATSIVLELQAMAADRNNDVPDLLRKALIVATKLKLDDFKRWVNRELHGYGADDEVPKYRDLRTQMFVLNPYHGLQPLYMPPTIEKQICDLQYRAPISNAVSVLERQRQGNKSAPQYPLPPEAKQLLMRHMEIPLEPVRVVPETQLDLLVDAVRTTILEWALKLEEEGIMGDGMTFSQEEKQRAASSTQIHIGSFQGVLGDVSQSQVTQNLKMNVEAGDFKSLADFLKSKGVAEPDINDLQTAIESDPTPSSSDKLGPRVSSWIGTMITKAACGTWSVGVDVAGKLLYAAVAAHYGLGIGH